MTRKDYELIAAALRKSHPAGDPAAHAVWRRSVIDIADALAAENPRFDANRFVDACTGRKA